MTVDQQRAYYDYHTQRNLSNARASGDEGVVVHPLPMCGFGGCPQLSPSRVCVAAFFRMAARSLYKELGQREVCILDIGCGSGFYAQVFEDAGFCGRYIGLDRQRHQNWTDRRDTPLTRELVIADVHAFDEGSLPLLDIIISSTALEHILDDLGTLERVRTRLRPGGGEAHFVPAEGALRLYGPHGWRQYSPRCMRRLFPHGNLYRLGGPVSSWLHYRVFTIPVIQGKKSAWDKLPKWLYGAFRSVALQVDQLIATGHPGRSPTMYAALCLPSHGVEIGCRGKGRCVEQAA